MASMLHNVKKLNTVSVFESTTYTYTYIQDLTQTSNSGATATHKPQNGECSFPHSIHKKGATPAPTLEKKKITLHSLS